MEEGELPTPQEIPEVIVSQECSISKSCEGVQRHAVKIYLYHFWIAVIIIRHMLNRSLRHQLLKITETFLIE